MGCDPEQQRADEGPRSDDNLADMKSAMCMIVVHRYCGIDHFSLPIYAVHVYNTELDGNLPGILSGRLQ